jgi:hypothetical protein
MSAPDPNRGFRPVRYIRTQGTRVYEYVRGRWRRVPPPRTVVTPSGTQPVVTDAENVTIVESSNRGWLALTLLLLGVIIYLLVAPRYGWPPYSPLPDRVVETESVFDASTDADLPPRGAGVLPNYAIGERFRGYYEANGGLAVLGLPISAPGSSNGREYQWFERARLEHWPEYAGTPYEVMLGRLGAEYTTGIDFPGHPYVVSTPERIYFRETGHSISGGFLRFWEGRGGLRTFGYPISDELKETIGGRTYTVQYFERARFEYHENLAGTGYDVQLGLLGRALHLADAEPEIIQP